MTIAADSRARPEIAQERERNTVSVLLFALAAELLGSERIDVPLEDRTTVSDIERHVRALPGGERLPRVRIAVNHSFAEAEQPVRAGDEVAVIPPVAGG